MNANIWETDQQLLDRHVRELTVHLFPEMGMRMYWNVIDVFM